MKTLKYRYYLRIDFDQPVTRHSFTVRCAPQSDERQRIYQQRIQILPKEFLCENRDSFGNCYVYGKAEHAHQLFEVISEGMAQTGQMESTAAQPAYRQQLYGQQTDYTRPGPGLLAFWESLQGGAPACPADLGTALWLMEALRRRFSYVPGKTDISTTAEQAWQLGCGVCQDYAHILLSLCRLAGVQARYVAGMLLGEGASHAWVEVAADGRWYGLDPTNDVRVCEDHIKISHGRDYEDCLLNQGIFTGNARQQQFVSVQVEEMRGEHL